MRWVKGIAGVITAVGVILVLALLITPAATARLFTDRLGVMMATAPVVGFISAFIGIYLSWVYDVPTGAAIVLVATCLFILAWLFAPRRGVVTSRLRTRHHRPAPLG